MNTIRTGAIDTAYDLRGPEGAPVIMLSHSLATCMRMWSPQWDALAGEYRLLSYDTRGHGASSAPAADYGMAELAMDAVALLDALSLERVHWLGVSMGGMIGQQLALLAPDRLLSLTLADTTSTVPPEAGPAWEERAGIALEQGMDALVAPTIDRWFTPAFCAEQPDMVEAVREMIRSTPPAGYAGCCAAIRSLALTDALAGITLPTLVMVGEADEGTPVSAAETIAGAIAGAELEVLPVARHLSNIEAAAPFNARLRAFLSPFT